MNDYTPRTEEIRNVYAFWMNQSNIAQGLSKPEDTSDTLDNFYEMFDRWLESVKAEERAEERERIIAFLLDGWERENSLLIKAIRGGNDD
jgi:hypothetical protein